MTQIKLRRDTTANWATANSVLAQGEPAIDTTTNSMKIGDGSSAWTDLQYIVPPPPPTPAIEYTGVFGGLPYQWRYTATPPKLQYAANGSFAVTGSNLYWLDQNFDDGYYDLSGLTSIRFTNIGGVKGYFDFSAKSEVVMTTLDMGDISVVDEWFNFAGFSNTLTTFAANNLTDVGGGLTVYGNSFDNGPAMVFPALNRITDNLYVDWNWNGMANTAAPSFPALTFVGGGVALYYNRYTTWSDFPLLEKANYIDFYQNTNNEGSPWACPGFPLLNYINGNLNINGNQYMTTVPDFTSLTHCNSIYMQENPDLTAFPQFPALTYCATLYAPDCYVMTSVGDSFMPSLLWMDGDVQFQNNALSQEAVDKILVKLASLDGTNGTTSYDYRTINVSGGNNTQPSQTGFDAIAVLQARGCNVITN